MICNDSTPWTLRINGLKDSTELWKMPWIFSILIFYSSMYVLVISWTGVWLCWIHTAVWKPLQHANAKHHLAESETQKCAVTQVCVILALYADKSYFLLGGINCTCIIISLQNSHGWMALAIIALYWWQILKLKDTTENHADVRQYCITLLETRTILISSIPKAAAADGRMFWGRRGGWGTWSPLPWKGSCLYEQHPAELWAMRLWCSSEVEVSWGVFWLRWVVVFCFYIYFWLVKLVSWEAIRGSWAMVFSISVMLW